MFPLGARGVRTDHSVANKSGRMRRVFTPKQGVPCVQQIIITCILREISFMHKRVKVWLPTQAQPPQTTTSSIDSPAYTLRKPDDLHGRKLLWTPLKCLFDCYVKKQEHDTSTSRPISGNSQDGAISNSVPAVGTGLSNNSCVSQSHPTHP